VEECKALASVEDAASVHRHTISTQSSTEITPDVFWLVDGVGVTLTMCECLHYEQTVKERVPRQGRREENAASVCGYTMQRMR